MTKVRAEYLSNKANDKISSIFKELTELQYLVESEEYQSLIESKDKELQNVVELGCLPPNFFEFLQALPDMF